MLLQSGGFVINQQVVVALVVIAFLLGSLYVQLGLASPYRLRRKGGTVRRR